MIRSILVQEETHLLEIIRKQPALGARMEVDWLLLCQNPAMPYIFYSIDEKAVLELSGSNAVLCGKVENTEELESFLNFFGVIRLSSTGWYPQNWGRQYNAIMQRNAQQKIIECDTVEEIDVAPRLSEVLDVLESSDGRLAPESARDGFYSDVCSRRNYGYADIVGVRKKNQLVSTVGAYCITATQVYIACVETIPEQRNKGYASALLAYICNKYNSFRQTLLCQESLVSFYNKFGFIKLQKETVVLSYKK